MNINTSAVVAAAASNAGRAGAPGFKVDVARGERVGRVSSEWFSRPDDERYLSLPALYEAVCARADRAEARTVGVLAWATMTHNPYVDVTKETTTLCASDRDVFLFLVDDTHPIEAGRLPNGDPDLYFRGFYCWNSEVGSKTLGIASFYLRAVCMNRAQAGPPNRSTSTQKAN